MTNNYQVISDLIDIIAEEAPVDWESLNYEGVKEISIMNALEQVRNLHNNPLLSEEEKEQTLVSILAYLLMENTILHVSKINSINKKN